MYVVCPVPTLTPNACPCLEFSFYPIIRVLQECSSPLRSSFPGNYKTTISPLVLSLRVCRWILVLVFMMRTWTSFVVPFLMRNL